MPPAALDDDALLGLLLAPHTRERGFRLLVETYRERLYRHIRRMVNTHEDTDDVLQNTFIKAFRGIDNFKGESKLFSWLYRIATNESLTFLSREKKHQSVAADDPETGVTRNLKAEAPSDGEGIRQLLDRAVAGLPDKQKLVFNMRYYDEVPYEEMSQILGTSVGALKASYHHAVKKIEEFVLKNNSPFITHHS